MNERQRAWDRFAAHALAAEMAKMTWPQDETRTDLFDDYAHKAAHRAAMMADYPCDYRDRRTRQ